MGDYRLAIFTAICDGHGGTIVVAIKGMPTRPPHAMISAMASLGASPSHANHVAEPWSAREPLLTGPRVAPP